MNKLNVLVAADLFRGLGIQDILSVINSLHASMSSYNDGDVLIGLGRPVECAGIILNGVIQAKTAIGDVGAEYGESGMFAEDFAGAKLGASPISFVAVGSCTVLWIDPVKLVAAYDNPHHATLTNNLFSILSKKSIVRGEYIDILSKRTTRERIMEYLEKIAAEQGSRRVRIPLSRVGLAEYICVDRSAMTRELSKMQKEGVLKFNKNEFELPVRRR